MSGSIFWADLGPERANFGSERVDFRPGRANFGPERPDLKPERGFIEGI